MSSLLDVREDVFDKNSARFIFILAFNNTHWCIFSSVSPPKRQGGPWTVAVCQPCRTLNVKERKCMGKEICTQDCQSGPQRVKSSFVFPAPLTGRKGGKPRLWSRKQLSSSVWGSDQHNGGFWRSCTPERLQGRISCVIGGIYTLPVKNRGPRRRYQLL